MANVMNWLVLTIFAVIVVYYMVSTAYTIASPNVIEAINFDTDEAYFALANTPVVVVNSVSNATATVPISNVTWNTTHASILLSPGLDVGTYNVNYDYQAPATVFGINLGFMGFLVLIGVGIVVVLKLIK